MVFKPCAAFYRLFFMTKNFIYPLINPKISKNILLLKKMAKKVEPAKKLTDAVSVEDLDEDLDTEEIVEEGEEGFSEEKEDEVEVVEDL